MPALFRRSRNATKIAAAAGRPGLERAAAQLARSIPDHVPVHYGVVKRTYRPQVETDGDSVRVRGFGSFWHLLEYGTAFTPPYRPIESAVADAGLKWEAH